MISRQTDGFADSMTEPDRGGEIVVQNTTGKKFLSQNCKQTMLNDGQTERRTDWVVATDRRESYGTEWDVEELL